MSTGSDGSGLFADSPRTKIQTEVGSKLDSTLVERRCRLTVLSGDQRGRSVEIGSGAFLVGKGENADLLLTDSTVSREHFVIEQTLGGFVIRDKQSTNGTWIDQFRIREAYLRPGVTVRAGEVQMRFESLFRQLEVPPSEAEQFGDLIGRSVRMRQIFALLERVAKTDATVVLLGETGSGKSAVARAVHNQSARAKKPFVTVDCGAIPENLIESELFGHERGAFTGAVSQRRGALEQAQGGTLFIDELVDLPLHLQPRLLRVLEEREVRRVGGNEPIKLDVRIIAASRKDLWREVEAGRFREDLYFRLAVFTIPLPPLRERSEDIPVLAASFADSLAGGQDLAAKLRAGGGARLAQHPFYGNVRELRNVIERAVHLGADPADELAAAAVPSRSPTGAFPTRPPPSAEAFAPAPSLADREPDPGQVPGEVSLPEPELWKVAQPLPAGDLVEREGPDGAVPLFADCTVPFKEAKEKLLDAFEREYLRRLIERSDDNASAMARDAGIDRKHLYNLAKKHDVELKK